MNLKQVIDELTEERGIDRTTLDSIVCEGMLAAYIKKYPDINFHIQYDHNTGAVEIEAQKRVVSTVEDEDAEISLKKARFIDKDIEVGGSVIVPFEGKIGRIEILHARQVISNRIRAVEALAVFNEFKDKEGEVVHGIVHKSERGGTVVKLDDVLAFLPNSLAVPTDRVAVGAPMRALLKEVLPEPKNDYQLILDRSSSQFLTKLFELEVPEVFERLVEIRKIVRVAGYKSKMIVSSRDKNIDPVGTCVGQAGARIRPISAELGGEKIDVIQATDSIEDLVAQSLKPAKVNRVTILDRGVARVWVDEDQRSLAIGRGGQNILLASRLVGLDIQLDQSDAETTSMSFADEVAQDHQDYSGDE